MVDKNYDLVVIGGGIIGLATAMRVTEEFPDLKVAVLEKKLKSHNIRRATIVG